MMHPATARPDPCDDSSDLVAIDIAAMSNWALPRYPELPQRAAAPVLWGTTRAMYDYLQDKKIPISLNDLRREFHDPTKSRDRIIAGLNSLATRNLIRRHNTETGIYFQCLAQELS